MNVFKKHERTSRAAYLKALCGEVVRELAALLGPEEDFDGLVTALEELGL